MYDQIMKWDSVLYILSLLCNTPTTQNIEKIMHGILENEHGYDTKML